MTQEGTAGRFAKMLLWGATFVFGLLMLLAGASKFAQPDMWTENFRIWGYPAAFAYVVGGLEVLGAVGVFVPKLATYAAGMITVIMMGAAATLIMNPGTLGPPTVPLINTIAFAALAYFRRNERWTTG